MAGMNASRSILDRVGAAIDKRHGVIVGLVFAVACIFLMVRALGEPDDRLGPDGVKYEKLGYEVSTSEALLGCGNFEHAYWSPGWATNVAIVYRLFGRRVTAVRLFLVLTALATAFLVYLVARRTAGRRAAAVAPAFFLFSSLVFRFTGYYQYEIPLAFLTFSSLSLLLLSGGGRVLVRETCAAASLDEDKQALAWNTALKGNLYRRAGEANEDLSGAGAMRILAAGILLGLASMYSPRVLVTVFIAGGCFYLRGRLALVAKGLLLLAAGILIVLAPWTIRNYRCFGELIPTTTNGGVNLYIGNNPHSTGGYSFPPAEARPEHEVWESGKWLGEAIEYIRLHPWRTAGRSIVKGLVFWNPHYGDQVVILLAFVGGLVRIRKRRIPRRGCGFFWLTALPFAFMLVHMAFFVQPRYMLPALPAVAVIAGIGLFGFDRKDRMPED